MMPLESTMLRDLIKIWIFKVNFKRGFDSGLRKAAPSRVHIICFNAQLNHI